MVFLIILIVWLRPIVVFGIYAWFNMESGESVNEFVSRKDLETDFMLIWFPLLNVCPLIKILLRWLFNYVLSLRKP